MGISCNIKIKKALIRTGQREDEHLNNDYITRTAQRTNKEDRSSN
jgi:hypothetical protein